ncbi:TPA: hypothetical protein N0F65_012400 [Lagenidium giganteum]|uniref:Uncharacterized protein n=1 Tax=Lagenidium giganteum TaxID=4803 RepID=A0AAV2YRG5_9STRA|nr:TPA: hypothetical protein N0F65_012400 [Lagenidium giganteum]
MANPRAEGGTIGENSTWWLKEDVKRAVGQALDDEDCGRDFVADVQDYVHVSELGAHWETLQTCKGRVSCNLCDTARWSIQQYRKEAKEMLKKFNEALKVKRAKWRSQGKDEDEMHQLRSEMKTQWFPDDSFPDINFADGTDDDILADICESGKFPLNPFCGMAAGFVHGDDDIFNALSAQTVFIGRRLQRSWMCSDQAWIKGELIAGITRSGFLYGVFLVVHRPDY